MEQEDNETNQQKLLDIERQQRISILKHTFQLIIIVEGIVIVTQLFMLSYYKLYSPKKNDQIHLWISFYYSCQDNYCFNNKLICDKMNQAEEYYHNYCKSANAKAMNSIRYILSGILIVIILIISFDIYRIININKQLEQKILDTKFVYKAKKYQLFIVLLLTIYYIILLLFILLVDGSNQSELGTSFYIGMVGTLSYLSIIIYFRYIKGRFTRATMFETLLRQELLQSELNLQEIGEIKRSLSDDQFYSLK